MKETIRVLLCDDLEERGKEALRVIERTGDELDCALEVRGLFDDELQIELESLFDVERSLLDDSTPAVGESVDQSVAAFEQTALGSREYDVALIDNNLKALKSPGVRVTVDAIAGYVRAFSSIPYVVSLNKWPEMDFDLRYLMGDRDGLSDFGVNLEHLEIHALWTGRREPGHQDFLPWYWPDLYHAADARKGQIAFVKENLDKSVLGCLGFPDDCLEYLSRNAVGRLSPLIDESDNEYLEKLRNFTFKRFFVEACTSLPVRTEREVIERYGKESERGRVIMARVVAAELEKWLRSEVIGPQDLLVDVPHLLMRMPFLLTDRASSIAEWNRALEVSLPPFGIDMEIFERSVSQAIWGGCSWVNRPCFWWPKLKSDGDLNDAYFHSEIKWEEAVFCEDISSFVLLKGCGRWTPREFSTELEGASRRRYVARVKSRNYVPRSRFAL